MYSYSVVLMELTRGMKAIDQCREKREMALADMFISKFHMRLFIRLLIRCFREKKTVVLRCFGVLQWIRIIVLMQRRSLEILRGLKTVHVWVKMMWRKTNCWIRLQWCDVMWAEFKCIWVVPKLTRVCVYQTVKYIKLCVFDL